MTTNSTIPIVDAELLSEIRKQLRCDDLEVRVESRWTSKDKNNRLEIREALSSALNEDLTDLSRPPVSRTHAISISHCPGWGGYAMATRPHALGFDLECELRVTETVVARVSSPKEIKEAPGVAHLWAAKEAAYKSFLGFEQPSVISSVFIRDWVALTVLDATLGKSGRNLNVWKFVGGHGFNRQGAGVLVRSESFLMSIFSRESST